jgi:hypothetical protein
VKCEGGSIFQRGCVFQINIVVVVDIVYSYYGVAPLEEAPGEVVADSPCGIMLCIKICDFIPQGRNVYAPNIIRCRIPRGDTVCLIAADMQVPQNVSVRHGAEAVLRPQYIKVYCTSLSILIVFNNFPVASFCGPDTFNVLLFFK